MQDGIAVPDGQSFQPSHLELHNRGRRTSQQQRGRDRYSAALPTRLRARSEWEREKMMDRWASFALLCWLMGGWLMLLCSEL